MDIKNINKLLEVMVALRDPENGCPWDREQDFRSIAPYTIEEAYEVADAIDQDDIDQLRDELGDLLLQVVFHAQMANEQGSFAFDDVVAAITEKMIRRHPHVFGDAQVDSAEAQTAAWEVQKSHERARTAAGETGVLDGVTLALPALVRAFKLGKRASSVGFDWPDSQGVRAKISEELAELAVAESEANPANIAEEIGDLLFSVANLARHLGVDPEESLRAANQKFTQRFGLLEEQIKAQGRAWGELTSAELEILWQQVKRTEKKPD